MLNCRIGSKNFFKHFFAREEIEGMTMRKTMISNQVPILVHSLKDFGMLEAVFSYAKETSFYSIIF